MAALKNAFLYKFITIIFFFEINLSEINYNKIIILNYNIVSYEIYFNFL